MAEINKPDYTYLWSSGGATVAPSNVKIQTGWTAEVPPFQWENWSQNRQDQAIAHTLQHGIALWDSLTEYQVNTSYTQGSNGVIYRCTATHTNINPVTDITGTWVKAFVSPTEATKVATATEARAQTSNTVYISPLQLANAFTGAKQSLLVNGYQTLPGGIILQWGGVLIASANTQTTFNFPTPFPNQCFKLFVTTDNNINAVSSSQGYVVNNSTASASVSTPNTGISWFAVGI